jgi:hypothetical protein
MNLTEEIALMLPPPTGDDTPTALAERIIDRVKEHIACMADERSKQWIADGVRIASGQHNPFPEFAHDLRARPVMRSG